ncbi:ribosomal protein S18-alanine N-acetyltransferase [Mangrovicoccus sp. HB161399]|uniref:ribosomal protein S18-alanine N-acetyltransferase n=1 Tax=Mangrovicoccus sp. HB161399 TaxID=2720392 RepID=UPI001551F9A5|nr:ribosomal protein S18-alanine N-acetyltransferase [Mangrovicoccus sp. HB161399]
MTPAEMAALHAACFVTPRPWSEAEIAGLLDGPGCFAVAGPGGFAMGRAIAGEAELLTIAVDPACRRTGLGRRLLDAFEAAARKRGADTAFLEVSAANAAARALYVAGGYAETGRRKGYYRAPDGSRIDALVMSRKFSPPELP